MLTRSQLRPGTLVFNQVSGVHGKVRSGKNGRKLSAHRDYVAVVVIPQKGRRQYPYWRVANLEFSR